MVPYVFANTSRRGGAHLDASWRDMASPPRATTLSFCNCLISDSDTVSRSAGVVVQCVAPLEARQRPKVANVSARDAQATVPPATQVAIKSPNEGSNVCGEATKTTDCADTACALFLALQKASRARCVATQPFGRPVEPEVKNTWEMDNGPRRIGGNVSDRSEERVAGGDSAVSSETRTTGKLAPTVEAASSSRTAAAASRAIAKVKWCSPGR